MRSLILAAVILPAAARAQETRDVSGAIDAMSECRAVTVAADRLACFDRRVAAVMAAHGGRELLVVDRRHAEESRRRRFGLGDRSDDRLGRKGERQAAVRELSTIIRAAVPAAAYGRWDLRLADGSVWQTIDRLPFPPKVSAPITLRTATLGGYRASIGQGRSFLVKRLR